MRTPIDIFNDMLDYMEFTLERHSNGEWHLYDRQGGNLGDIESDIFNDILDIIERLDAYIIDYFEEPFVEYFEIDDYANYDDLVKQVRQKLLLNPQEYADYSEWDLQILEFVTKAPTLEICTKPLDDLRTLGLLYEEID